MARAAAPEPQGPDTPPVPEPAAPETTPTTDPEPVELAEPAPSGFQPIEYTPPVQADFTPIEYTPYDPAAPASESDQPAAGSKEQDR